MYRDKTLIPTEAIRLLALGYLATAPARYGDVAGEVRQFTSRITGPSLDVLGTSIELLRYEGMVEPIDGQGMADNALLRITDAGRAELQSLLKSRVRTPVDGMNKLILALKLRYLHLLEPAARREQIETLIDMSRSELARLEDLSQRYRDEPGHLIEWLEHDRGQVQARIDWLEDLRNRA
jgi:DNA-binding PadR family transcriptional regulator